MKGSDKAVLFGVVMAIVLAAFYLKVLGPKRDEASSLKKGIADLHAQIDEQTQVASFAEDARQHFPTYYGRLVVVGKAVPAGADTGSLLVELNSIANRSGVKFNALKLSAGSGEAASAPASSSTESTSSTSTTSTTPDSSSAAATTTPTPATEASAANLPLGASIGTAGLPTMPYDLTFQGSYFDIANFLKGVDDLVRLRDTSQVAADGRLLTVNGFALSPAENSDPQNPTLQVTLAVTSYVTPSDQGLTAGASPGGPSISQTTAQPASATVSP